MPPSQTEQPMEQPLLNQKQPCPAWHALAEPEDALTHWQFQLSLSSCG